MRKFAKIIQSDKRGQIVIPKDVRRELNIDDGAGFYLYVIENEGILLKTIPNKDLAEHSHIVKEIEVNAEKINVKKQNIDKSVENYKKEIEGQLRECNLAHKTSRLGGVVSSGKLILFKPPTIKKNHSKFRLSY